LILEKTPECFRVLAGMTPIGKFKVSLSGWIFFHQKERKVLAKPTEANFEVFF
jgi:hypothetical protein